jgi:hypothetical protein
MVYLPASIRAMTPICHIFILFFKDFDESSPGTRFFYWPRSERSIKSIPGQLFFANLSLLVLQFPSMSLLEYDLTRVRSTRCTAAAIDARIP